MSVAKTNNKTQSKNQETWSPLDMFLWPLAQGARWDLEHTGESFMPRVDIHEDKEAIHVDVELAGIPKEKIQIDHEDDLLTISGENEIKKDETDKDKKWHRIERKFGSFKRQILLPQGVDQSTITASHKDGLLTITIPKPKQPEKKQSKIEVK